MKTEAEIGIKKLYGIEGQAEIIGGRIVRLPFHTGFVDYAIGAMLVSLRDYTKRYKHIHALGSTVAYLVDLPHRKAFCPDVAVSTSALDMSFPEGAPMFAAEVRDPKDYGPAAERRIAAKRADYFAAGTLVVWDADTQGEDAVRVYRADEPSQPTIYRRGEVAEAEPALPGWTMAVDELFPDK